MSKKSKFASKRDDPKGPVMVIPHYVLNSDAYKTLSGNAIRLLYDIAMQYNGRDNNGSLLGSYRFMSEKRGWTSAGSLREAMKMLEERNLIVKTVQGRLPNKASWFAVGWAALSNLSRLDITTQSFPRGEYARWKPTSESKLRRKMPPPPKLISKGKMFRNNIDASCPTEGSISA